MFSLQVKLRGEFGGEERHQTRIRHSFGLAVVFDFHLKDRSSVHIFPHFKPYMATELASWLNHFCITSMIGDVCPPFPALALASRLVKQTCLLGSSNCGVHISPNHSSLFDFAVKQKGSTPLFPHRSQFRGDS